ncbi:MAG: hypothetical protein QNJ31_02895 [Candidatus Caenarcaniphilales bacterium]|nr:hypothetical protein [Candidatus Caenarcaniphilales bacterium]
MSGPQIPPPGYSTNMEVTKSFNKISKGSDGNSYLGGEQTADTYLKNGDVIRRRTNSPIIFGTNSPLHQLEEAHIQSITGE